MPELLCLHAWQHPTESNFRQDAVSRLFGRSFTTADLERRTGQRYHGCGVAGRVIQCSSFTNHALFENLRQQAYAEIINCSRLHS